MDLLPRRKLVSFHLESFGPSTDAPACEDVRLIARLEDGDGSVVERTKTILAYSAILRDPEQVPYVITAEMAIQGKSNAHFFGCYRLMYALSLPHRGHSTCSPSVRSSSRGGIAYSAVHLAWHIVLVRFPPRLTSLRENGFIVHSLRRRPFSSRNRLASCASLTSMPPYFDFQAVLANCPGSPL